MCQQFFNEQACKIGEPFCTFAHSEAEAELWLMELNGALDLTSFVHDQQRFRIQSKFLKFSFIDLFMLKTCRLSDLIFHKKLHFSDNSYCQGQLCRDFFRHF